MAEARGNRAPTWLEQMEARSAEHTASDVDIGAAPTTPEAPGELPLEAPGEAERPEIAAETELSKAPAEIVDSAAPLQLVQPAEATARPDSRPRNPWADQVESLRSEALFMARDDADAGMPGPDAERSESENVLRERCAAVFERWRTDERQTLDDRASEQEQTISDGLGKASLGIDRFERLTNELVRLKARLTIRKEEVTTELEEGRTGRQRGLPTKVYLVAIAFLGLVEFFANSPVFSALLPRDPLTERQIRLVAETSEGWMAGIERVFAHLVLRPDAALLAAGVVTFLCVLAHFFGHSLRELVMHGDRQSRRDTHSTRTPVENVVPMVLSGLGLLLVLGVLYEARMTLGQVGTEQYDQDMEVVVELRRNASWLRVDGNLLEANEQENRAADMEAAALELREYSGAMSRLSFPILLLNATLVLCAISAAYFHRRDSRREQFNESPFENERRAFIEAAEETALEVSNHLAGLTRSIQSLKSLVRVSLKNDAAELGHQLESVVATYRAENGRIRGIDPRALPAFAKPARLDLAVSDEGGVEALRAPGDYEEERQLLRVRFEEVRTRFNREAIAL